MSFTSSGYKSKEAYLNAQKRYYHNNKEEFLAKTKVKRQRRIDYLYERLGKECVQCGSTENLEFDHINPALKLTRTPPQALGRDNVDKEIDNLQVLCHNCHKVKTRAQKAAAWHLFCLLSEQEQTELTHAFEEHSIKPKTL